MSARLAAAAVLAWLTLAPAARAQETPPPDLVGRVLQHEIERAVGRLKLEGGATPYFVEYSVNERVSFAVMAAFGAVVNADGGRSRKLAVDLRVGDYALDNTNFGGGGADFMEILGISMGGGGRSMPVDDDYDALRHGVWLATDAAYKASVEELEKKKAFLQQNDVKDRPEDLERRKPVVHTGPLATLEVDRDKCAALARKLAGIFRECPWVKTSFVGLWTGAGNRWLANNEGFRIRDGGTQAMVMILAGAQGADGMSFADGDIFAARSVRELPSEADLEKAVRSLAGRLKVLVEAPPMAEEYRGPVLFEDQAAGELFAQLVIPQMGNSHEPVGKQDGGMGMPVGNPWRDRLGSKVAAGLLTVVSDPTLKEHGGRPVFGGWAFDDDGVPAERVTVIEKGTLKDFCMSRIPTRHLKKSNGHSQDGVGTAGPVLVLPDGPTPAKELRNRLIAMGKEEGLEAVYIVRRISNLLSGALNPTTLVSSLMSRFTTGGGVGLYPPVMVFKVSVADGTETLVRGARFGRVSLRALRDIVAAGDDGTPRIVLRGASIEGDNATPRIGTVVAPSVLIKEIEIAQPGKETEKPPLLKHPFFEGK